MNGRRASVVVALSALLVVGFLLWQRGQGPEAPPAKTAAGAVETTARDSSKASSPPASKSGPLPSRPIAPARVRIEAQDEAGEPQRARFSGRVVSLGTGVGIAAAELTFSKGQTAASVTTDADGRFRFDVQDDGVYQVAEVTAEGFTPFAPPWGQSPLMLSARAGRHVRDIVIELAAEKTIVGQLVDAEEAPVANASVTLWVAAGPRRLPTARSKGYTSEADGKFRFRAPVGTIIEAKHADAGVATMRLTANHVKAGEVLIRFDGRAETLLTERIAGVVLDSNDTPVPDVAVHAAVEITDRFSEVDDARTTRTDAEGRFRFERLRPGAYTLSARTTESMARPVTGVQAGRDDVVLRLGSPGGFIAGRITRASDGESIASFVVLVSRSLGRVEEQVVLTRSFVDPEGRYRAGPVEPGAYLVRVVAEGYATSKAIGADVEAGEDDTVDAQLSRGATVNGAVVDTESGRPVAGARVSHESSILAPALPIPVEKIALTDGEGRFEVGGIAPGRFSLVARADGYNHRIVSGLEAVDGQLVGPVEIQMSPLAENEKPKVELAGIGAVLTPDGDTVLVGRVIDLGGAAEAGVAPGDRIVSIDGQPVGDLDFVGIVQLIRGPVGSTVLLGIRAENGQTKTIAVPRRAIKT